MANAVSVLNSPARRIVKRIRMGAILNVKLNVKFLIGALHFCAPRRGVETSLPFNVDEAQPILRKNVFLF